MKNTTRSADKAAILLLFSMTLMARVTAFISPLQRAHHRTATSLTALPAVDSFLLADGLSAATRLGVAGNGDFSSLAGPLSSLRTFFIVLTASGFGLTALAYLTAVVIVPRAAEQLERDTRRLRPGLWEDYEAKLEDGENMVMRPDLLQELGNVMQPIIFEDYEKEAAIKFDQGTASASPAKDEGSVIKVAMKPPEEN